MTVTTVKEYFFIVTADPQDKSTWIYAHQTLDSLCLHKLDRKTMTKVINNVFYKNLIYTYKNGQGF